MIRQTHLTVGQIADIYQVPAWKIRRVVDSLDVEVERVGLYRVVPRDALTQIGAELDKRSSRSKSGAAS